MVPHPPDATSDPLRAEIDRLAELINRHTVLRSAIGYDRCTCGAITLEGGDHARHIADMIHLYGLLPHPQSGKTWLRVPHRDDLGSVWLEIDVTEHREGCGCAACREAKV